MTTELLFNVLDMTPSYCQFMPNVIQQHQEREKWLKQNNSSKVDVEQKQKWRCWQRRKRMTKFVKEMRVHLTMIEQWSCTHTKTVETESTAAFVLSTIWKSVSGQDWMQDVFLYWMLANLGLCNAKFWYRVKICPSELNWKVEFRPRFSRCSYLTPWDPGLGGLAA